MDFLFGGYNWVNTIHILVGPILSLIAYMSHEYCFNDTFDEYKPHRVQNLKRELNFQLLILCLNKKKLKIKVHL